MNNRARQKQQRHLWQLRAQQQRQLQREQRQEQQRQRQQEKQERQQKQQQQQQQWQQQRAKAVGNRLLGEVEEQNLHQVLTTFRAQLTAIARLHQPPGYRYGALITETDARSIPIPRLNDLCYKNQEYQRRRYQIAPSGPPALCASGRHMALLYIFLANILAPPFSNTVVLIDAEGKFEARKLLETIAHSSSTTFSYTLTKADLTHLYVYTSIGASREQVRNTMKAAEKFMMYGNHRSKAREWWGTVVVGGHDAGRVYSGTGLGDSSFGWRGWLKVEKERLVVVSKGGRGLDEEERRVVTRPYPLMTTVKDALKLRDERQAMVDRISGKWWGRSRFGYVPLN